MRTEQIASVRWSKPGNSDDDSFTFSPENYWEKSSAGWSKMMIQVLGLVSFEMEHLMSRNAENDEKPVMSHL